MGSQLSVWQRGLTVFAIAWVLALSACISDQTTEDQTTVVPESSYSDGGIDDGTCVDDARFFEEKVQGLVLTPTCSSCHHAAGAARDSDLIFAPTAQPNHLETNRAMLTHIAGLERDGTSLLLLKPLGLENHGGGQIITPESQAYTILSGFIARLSEPVVCEEEETDESDAFTDLELLSPVSTLRKATLLLSGRLPTSSEVDRVRFGGLPELQSTLDQILGEEAFIERIKEIYNDRLLTDRYLDGTDAIGLIDYDRYPNLYWYESETNTSNRNALRAQLNEALAREPLELIAHVVREELPFTEILTANYTMANAYSALSMGAPLDIDANVENPLSRRYVPVQIEGVHHAGVLTTPAFLNRFPTTPTNRNRHRARIFFDRFLATDILAFADRPIDPSATSVHNPTLNDAQCTVCHDTLDPVAGLFQNWDDEGHFNPRDEGWYPEMSIPGFGESALPFDEQPSALQWLATKTAQDPRFALATAQTLFHGLTGLEILTAESIGRDELTAGAYQLQRDFLDAAAQALTQSDYNIRVLIKHIILSHYFRAAGPGEASEAALMQAGTAHLLTPEELSRKVEAVMGYPWSERYDRDPYLLDRYKMLYGGIDSDAVTERLVEPNGIISSIGLRLSYDLACRTVARDFVLPLAQRRLFPKVEPSYEPETTDGFAIPDAENRIKENIRYLHLRLLGEDLQIDDAEIETTYRLFYETWKEGRAALESGEESINLHSRCQANQDFWTRQNLPLELRVRQDPTFTIRAWMATTTYLLSDYRFFYE